MLQYNHKEKEREKAKMTIYIVTNIKPDCKPFATKKAAIDFALAKAKKRGLTDVLMVTADEKVVNIGGTLGKPSTIWVYERELA